MRTIGNLQISGSLITSGSITATTFIGDGSGLTGVTSYTDSDTLSYINTLGVVSSSAQLSNQTIPGDLTIGGKITAQEFHTEFVSASIIYQSGSTQFGDTTDDTHTFIGTLSATTILGVVSSSAQVDYNSIQNQPTIPTNNNELTNGAGYTTCTGTVTSVATGTGLTGGTITSTGTISLSHLGLESLTDPNADRVAFWDDSAGAFAWLTMGTNLSITDTTLNATDTNTTYSAATMLTCIKTVDGASSGLDADLLDGVEGASFLRSDTADTATGALRFQNDLNYFGIADTNNEAEIIINTGIGGSPQIGFTDHGDASWAIGVDDGDNSFKIHGVVSATIPTINNLVTPLFEVTTTAGTAYLNGSTIWHAGNDGASSGLDADLLDGNHASAFYLATNPSGYTTCIGDITGVTAGTGLSGGGTSGTVTVNLSHLGFQNLTDPNADRVAFWDDSAGAFAWLTMGSGLSISGTTLTASGGTINNNVDNYVMTGTGTTGTLNGEANLQFNGSVLTVTGTVCATSIVETSAQKYKTDIQDLTETKYLNCLRPVSFKWKENGSEDIGFIAEEVNQFYPTLVAKSGEDEPTGVKYTKIVPLLVKKIQEQDKIISDLDKKLNDIYNKINKDT